MAKRVLRSWTATEDWFIDDRYNKHGYTLMETAQILKANGYTRTQDAVRNRAYQLRKKKTDQTQKKNQKWYDGMRIGFWDIETSEFKANFGHLMSWAVYFPDAKLSDLVLPYGVRKYRPEAGGIVIHDVLLAKEARDWELRDVRLVETMWKTIRHNADLVVTYWGKGFDAPFSKGRALYWGKDWVVPGVGELYHLDLFFQARKNNRLHRNSLGVHTEFLGIDDEGGKNHVKGEIWGKAKMGYKDALEYVDDHCKRDVVITASLFERYKPFFKFSKTSI